MDRNLKILVVAPEATPFAKVGGLADVAGSLPKALATLSEGELAHDVRLVLPKYQGVPDGDYVADFPISMGSQIQTAIIRESHMEAKYGNYTTSVPVYFIDNYHYFDRPGIYAHTDDAERFGFFCQAVLGMLPHLGFKPDLIHCNDWQSGLIPLYLRNKYNQNPFFQGISTVFTIHNLQYQGIFSPAVLKQLDIPNSLFTPEGIEFYGQVNFMKAGIIYADVINTVSQTYAREILTPEFGVGLDGLLRHRKADLFGIVNGINYHEFNPETDPRIYVNYNHLSPELKKENKRALQNEVSLPIRDLPVLGLVSRLVSQKGLDLFPAIFDWLTKEEVQLVFLGEGDRYYENLLQELAQRYPDKVSTTIAFNAVLAQRIYAGADIFLMPSAFEPCGLGQLISMRYGTIPVVRTTGGLADTVYDYTTNQLYGNGFVFRELQPSAFLDAIRRALRVYRERPQAWRELVARVMVQDFSWSKSGASYVELYQKALAKKARSINRYPAEPLSEPYAVPVPENAYS